jgi:hypothetical protein
VIIDSMEMTWDKDVAVVEASTIGLTVGQWPSMLVVSGVRYYKANRVADRENELVAVNYCSTDGRRIHVLND